MSADNTNVNKETGEISPLVSVVSDDMLAEIQSFDDALAVINEVFGGEIVEADKVLGTGFGIADEKAAYIGITLAVLKAERNPSDKGEKGRFWTLHAVAKDGRKVIINDGGSGIADQMDALVQRHGSLFHVRPATSESPERVSLARPMLVKKGLRASSYVHPTAGPSITYYLDTSGMV